MNPAEILNRAQAAMLEYATRSDHSVASLVAIIECAIGSALEAEAKSRAPRSPAAEVPHAFSADHVESRCDVCGQSLDSDIHAAKGGDKFTAYRRPEGTE